MRLQKQTTGVYAVRMREQSFRDAPRKGIPFHKKAPQPCAYGCGRSVYTVYAVAMCNVCRRQRGIPVWNE